MRAGAAFFLFLLTMIHGKDMRAGVAPDRGLDGGGQLERVKVTVI